MRNSIKFPRYKSWHLALLKSLLLLTFVAIAVLLTIWLLKLQTKGIPNIKNSSSKLVAKVTSPTPTITTTPTPTVSVIPATASWPVILSQGQANSITVVVNKKHKLPADYVPNNGDLREETKIALSNLVADALNNGYSLKLISGYRSYSNQQSTYNGWVNQYGQEYADTISARAGHSEHQTGLAVDVGNGTCDLETCFGDTEAGKWVATNAQNYGFIIRYPNGKEGITGYSYEPWHLRYLGTDTAKLVYESGKTLDEYYSVPAGDYQ